MALVAISTCAAHVLAIERISKIARELMQVGGTPAHLREKEIAIEEKRLELVGQQQSEDRALRRLHLDQMLGTNGRGVNIETD